MENKDLLELIKTVTETNQQYFKDRLNFTDYSLEKMEDRGVNQDLVIDLILTKQPYYAQKQKVILKGKEETRYKLIYKISSKYSIIIVISYAEKDLNIINVIKTSKKAEKLWRKNLSK
ncbi:MAG: hypothetical protein AABW89_00485 [Nanoarchaeota archaeon]